MGLGRMAAWDLLLQEMRQVQLVSWPLDFVPVSLGLRCGTQSCGLL